MLRKNDGVLKNGVVCDSYFLQLSCLFEFAAGAEQRKAEMSDYFAVAGGAEHWTPQLVPHHLSARGRPHLHSASLCCLRQPSIRH